MGGTAKTVTIAKDDTVILDGAGTSAAIEDRCEAIRDSIEATSSEYEKDKLRERLAKLSGGVAVIKVGGSSEVEVAEVKDRLNDALNATKAAVEEGIVPGGGTALLYASKSLSELQAPNFDQKVGIEIVQNALKAPCRTIANNAGMEGSVVVEKLLEGDVAEMGYNAATGQYTDLVKAGVIDPLKVVRTALLDASSVASLMMTSEVSIVDQPKESAAMPPNPAAGMGGMGGF